MMCVYSKQSPRRGAAAVEAAVVLPVLLFFVAGIVDLGRLPKVADSLTNAARNGAQFGMVNTTVAGQSANIRAAAVTEMANLPNVSSSNPTVTASLVTDAGSSTQFIKVTVTYDMTGFCYFSFFPVTSMSRTVMMPMMPQ
jgi:Flp pilus assembly protein TadG